MYMLRTEIRKLGGLICFLFVMLAIQAQQYTVTGGNGVPYLLENPGNRIRVYLVYGMDNVEISYTSSSTNHQWYRYKHIFSKTVINRYIILRWEQYFMI